MYYISLFLNLLAINVLNVRTYCATMRHADDQVGVAPAPADHSHLSGGVGVLQGGDEKPQLRPVPGIHDSAKLRLN